MSVYRTIGPLVLTRDGNECQNQDSNILIGYSNIFKYSDNILYIL